ncbi:MAG: peptidoglycan DD-metalloendopeptidase family protein [Ruminiclostridium sp.]|nr:peptidoglycan DD-metalloendopeptidase family protein [Ruminiclostridium sp.]
MEYKKAINDTINELKGSFRPADDDELVRAVQERAERMNDKNENIRQGSFMEISSEYAEPKKSHKVLNVFLGIAGTAAVLAGAVFGLNWLNEHGGLKEREIETSAGAGYSSNAETTTAAAKGFDYIFQSYSSNGSGYVNIDQRYCVGDDLTVHLKGYRFDGTLARIYYDLIYKDEIVDGLSSMPIRPKDSDIGHFENCQFGGGGTLFSCFVNYRFDTPSESAEVEFGYTDDPQSDIFSLTMYKSTDMIDEPAVTTAIYMTTPPVEATTVTAVIPDGSDADEKTTSGDEMEKAHEAELKELNDMKAYYEHGFEIYEAAKKMIALEIASLNQRKETLMSELAELQSLGKDTGTLEQDIKSVEEDIRKQEIVLESYSSETENIYDKLGAVKLKIMKIEAEMKNHIFYEIGDDETEDSEETTAMMNAPDETSRTGYYEGEEALNILKQYAGNDYCYPLENCTKDVINYRTHDEWTGDTSTDYRFNIPAEEGEPILAVTGGTVIETNSRNVPGQSEGIYITIQAADGRKWRYSHLSDYYVSEGDTVKAGDRIAAVGATGWCTGPLVCISFPDSEVIDPANDTNNTAG